MKKDKFQKFSFLESVKNLLRCNIEELKEKNSIIIDTNFLFVTFETPIDFISELERLFGKNYHLYVYEPTLLELDELSRRKTKNKKYLPLIAKMLFLYKFKVIKSDERYADELILKSLKKNMIIATNDKELRKRIWKKKGRVLYMRNKAYFECG